MDSTALRMPEQQLATGDPAVGEGKQSECINEQWTELLDDQCPERHSGDIPTVNTTWSRHQPGRYLQQHSSTLCLSRIPQTYHQSTT